MNKFIKMFFVFFMSVFFSCSSTLPGGMARSSSPADFGGYEVLGTGVGESKGVTVLGIQSSKPDLRAAIDEARRTLNGDALINVRWYVKNTSWFILPVVTTTVTVKGEVIKYHGGSK